MKLTSASFRSFAHLLFYGLEPVESLLSVLCYVWATLCCAATFQSPFLLFTDTYGRETTSLAKADVSCLTEIYCVAQWRRDVITTVVYVIIDNSNDNDKN